MALDSIDDGMMESAEFITQTKAVFRASDRDKSGEVSKNELFQALRKFKVAITSKEYNQVFRVIDPDQSHQLTLEEWVDFMICTDAGLGVRKTQAEHNIHVGGIGVDGWDGTEDGVGTYESKEELEKIFGEFGTFVGAQIRHRIRDGENASWALVTMGDADSVDRALAEPAVMAGKTKLTLSRYSKQKAAASTGAMAQVHKEAGLGHDEEVGEPAEPGSPTSGRARLTTTALSQP